MFDDDEQAGIPEWVVTFGDMMSLLLTFFIMLFSMSEIKEQELYQAVAEALRKRFGYEATMTSLVPGRMRPRNSDLAKLSTTGRARKQDTTQGGDKIEAPVGEHPRVRDIRRGENTTVGGVVYFDPGSAELDDAHKQILARAAQQIGGKPTKIEIRGHTSMRPLGAESPYRDHWALAYARSRNVVDYLIGLGINPKRLRIAVAADNEPTHLGSDPVLEKENDRVEVVMLDQWVTDLQGTQEELEKLYLTPAASP